MALLDVVPIAVGEAILLFDPGDSLSVARFRSLRGTPTRSHLLRAPFMITRWFEMFRRSALLGSQVLYAATLRSYLEASVH